MERRAFLARMGAGLLAATGLYQAVSALQPGHAQATRVPELLGGPEDWINSKPLSMNQILDGRHIVLVDFWEYTCVNCIRTFPYLKEWHKRYAPEGLVILGIHTPEFAFARDRSNVEAAVKRFGLSWPILVDSGYANWNAYGNNVWPRKYLVDARGTVVYDHAGEGGYGHTESQIQRLLRQLHPGRVYPPPMAPVRDTDKPGAVCYPVTPEVYAGYQRGLVANAGPQPQAVVDRPHLFVDNVTHPDGRVVLSGLWVWGPESVRHARVTKDLSDGVTLRYHALEVNAVIKPEGKPPLRVYVEQDGLPLRRLDWGSDVRADAAGRPYLLVDTPRMYAVVNNQAFGSHDLRLASDSDGFGLYSYTFGSCTR